VSPGIACRKRRQDIGGDRDVARHGKAGD